MKPSVLVTSLLAAALVAAVAAQSKTEQLKGHLVDAVCAKGHANEPGYVENHTRMCNLMGGCIKSGYTLVTADKNVRQLDAKGAELALALNKSTDKEKDLKVTVTGTVTGSKIAVSAIALD
jgi:hypothetical protein